MTGTAEFGPVGLSGPSGAGGTAERLLGLASATATASLVRDRRLNDVLTGLAIEVSRRFGVSNCVVLSEWGADGLRGIGTSGMPRDYAQRLNECLRRGAPSPMEIAYRTRRLAVLPRVRNELVADDRWANLWDVVRRGTESSVWAAVPLIADARVVGVLGAGFTDSSEFDPHLLLDVGRVLGPAVDTALEFDRVRRTAQNAARDRLRQDLHDGLSQQLFSLCLQLEAATTGQADERALRRQLAEIRDLAASSLNALREVTDHTRPPSLVEIGLASSLRSYAEELSAQVGIAVVVDCDPKLSGLPEDLEDDVYRLVREACNNVVKHAQARVIRIEISLELVHSMLQVIVGDDGLGFEPSKVDGSRSGMRNMRARVARHGGELRISSQSGGGGSELRAEFPLVTNR